MKVLILKPEQGKYIKPETLANISKIYEEHLGQDYKVIPLFNNLVLEEVEEEKMVLRFM